MAFRFREHEADMGIVGEGSDTEEAFQEAGKALFHIMVDIAGVRDREKVTFEITSESIEKLFINYLNELLFLKDSKEMFFSTFFVNIHKHNVEGLPRYRLKAKVFGEKIDVQRHFIKTEVKAATYSGLKVYDLGGKTFAECVVDV